MTQRTEAPDHEIVVVGAGFSGLGAGIALRRAGFHDFVILDKRPDIGGVWLVNTYPGVAVDIASFTYSFSFEPNPDWSRMFAPGDELKRYADHLADKYRLRGHLRLNTEVQRATWNDRARLWRIHTEGGQLTARFLITANGGLTQPKAPDIDGLDDFTGKVMHTAEWDHSCDLTGKRAGIIGTGASALQVIPRSRRSSTGCSSTSGRRSGWPPSPTSRCHPPSGACSAPHRSRSGPPARSPPWSPRSS